MSVQPGMYFSGKHVQINDEHTIKRILLIMLHVLGMDLL